MSDATAKKEERRKFQAIKGTRDILPPETALWNRVEQIAREVFATYGFGEIRIPDFELARLFEHSIGDETDVITKELYSWIDSPRANQALRRVRAKAIANAYRAIHDDQAVREELFKQAKAGALDTLARANRISLRPEATASVCRAYIEHRMQSLPQPVKLYYMGPMFRREQPQKGRYRQFYQIGAEILGGSDAPGIDAEVIEMLMTFFDRVGLQGATLYINSIGHNAENCRRGYVEKLKAALEKVKDKLGPDSQRRIDTNPLRVLDSKLESEQVVIAALPHIADHLCDECKTHYAEVKRQLQVRGVLYQENWRLVRGLDYYMRTTFEITAPGLGSQNAVCGGGRYDGLVELLGGPPTKGIGFAIGEDRLILSLQEQGRSKEVASGEWRVASKEGKGVSNNEPWNLNGVSVRVNGESAGNEPATATLANTVQKYASSRGIRSASVFAGDRKLYTTDGSKTLQELGVTELNVVTKDQRAASGRLGVDVYVAWMGEKAYATAIRAAKDLRKAGYSVELPPLEQKFGKALGQADKLGAKYALILGDNEASEGLWTLKTLSDGTQQKLTESNLLEFLRQQEKVSS